LNADEAARVVKLFEHSYRRASTLRATFLETYSEGNEVVRSEAGTAYFRKPGQMRWEYTSPDKDVFVVDGKTVWFYVPEDHTVTRMPAKKSEDWRTPFALLAGGPKISRLCARVSVDEAAQPADKSLIMLRCKLRGAKKEQRASPDEALSPERTPDFVQIELVRSTGELKRVVIHESGDVIMEFRFANWDFNPPLSAKIFHFEAPIGVAIVNGELKSTGDKAGGP
jgi:outer membrane lipoprotein carrier protein